MSTSTSRRSSIEKCFITVSLFLIILMPTVSAIRDKDECAAVNDIKNISAQCAFIKITDDCNEHGGYINYMKFIYCDLTNRPIQVVGFLVLAIWLCYLLMSLGVASSKFFAPNLPVIADALRMNENVAGETLLALGNGAPDLFTSLAAALNMKGSGDAGFLYGELLGSGMFVTTIIVGVVVSIKPFQAVERAILRDLVFYMAAIYCAFFTLWDGVIHLTEAIMFLVIYATYFVTVLSANYFRPRFDKLVAKHAQKFRSRSITSNNYPTMNMHSSSMSQLQSPAQATNSGDTHLRSILSSPATVTDLATVSLPTVEEAPTEVLSSNTVARPSDDESAQQNSDQRRDVIPSVASGGNGASVIRTNIVSVTKTSRALLAARRSQPNKTTKSQSMKILPVDSSARFNLSPMMKKTRQLSLLGPRSRNRQAEVENHQHLPHHEVLLLIPHAARLMIRSASSKDKSTKDNNEDHDFQRSNSTPSRAKGGNIKRPSHITRLNEMKGVTKGIINTLHRAHPAVGANSSSSAAEAISDIPAGIVELPERVSELRDNNGNSDNTGNETTATNQTSAPMNDDANNNNSHLSANNQTEGNTSEIIAVGGSSDWQTFCYLLFKGLNPIDVDQMKRQRWYKNVVHVVRAPAVFFMKLTNPVVNEDKLRFNWNRPVNMLHCITSPVFFTATIFRMFKLEDEIADVMPATVLAGLVGLLVAAAVGFTSNNTQRPRYHVAFAFIGFATTMVWIYLLANEIINLLQCFGIALSISRSFLGLTCLAWGNSLGDVINDATIAKQGYPKMALSACYGGMLFNLLLGLGGSLLIATLRNGFKITIEQPPAITVIFIFLAVNTVSSFVSISLIQRFYLKRSFAFYLFTLYACFFTCAVLTECGVISLNIFNYAYYYYDEE